MLVMALLFGVLVAAIVQSVYRFTGFVLVTDKHGLGDLEEDAFIQRVE